MERGRGANPGKQRPGEVRRGGAQDDRIELRTVNDHRADPLDEDLRRAFRRLESVLQAEEGSAQARERAVLVTLTEEYENAHHGFGPVGPKRP